MNTLHARFGITALIGGALLAAVSLILGFVFLLTDQDDVAKQLLPLIPIGFLIAFTGLVASVLSESRQDDPR